MIFPQNIFICILHMYVFLPDASLHTYTYIPQTKVVAETLEVVFVFIKVWWNESCSSLAPKVWKVASKGREMVLCASLETFAWEIFAKIVKFSSIYLIFDWLLINPLRLFESSRLWKDGTCNLGSQNQIFIKKIIVQGN